MTVDCQWVEKNLEALFSDGLSEEENRLARAHIENCVSCRKETQALIAIDPLIKTYFRRQLGIARRPRVARRARVLTLGGAAAAVLVVLLLLLVRMPQTTPSTGPVAVQPNPVPGV